MDMKNRGEIISLVPDPNLETPSHKLEDCACIFEADHAKNKPYNHVQSSSVIVLSYVPRPACKSLKATALSHRIAQRGSLHVSVRPAAAWHDCGRGRSACGRLATVVGRWRRRSGLAVTSERHWYLNDAYGCSQVFTK